MTVIRRQLEKAEGKLVRTNGWRDYRTVGTAASRMMAASLEPVDAGSVACRKANAETLRDLERGS